ncbi:MAG TPA: 3-methyl-2-oxobutanoate hydroxymethyltransferase [bacterium]|jgi:3-methyl-2-oxobutanoate hydroxymethyltransferase|nr:3-methyl-2-oxobutanoate hydroxymethyltransferase [bacterium]
MPKRTTVLDFQAKCDKGEKLSIVTAYDYAMSMAVDAAGVDAILVGDSLNMTMLGRENTLSATLDEMLHHTEAVAKGAKNAMVIGDMPFLTYQLGPEQALENAGAFLTEAGAQAVKLEWCPRASEIAKFLVENGVPVMGHLGFTPQQIHRFGGYHQQGKDKASAALLLKEAKALEAAGAFGIVLELIPSDIAKKITASVKIPTIGIGAGPDCDGQVQVLHDLLGLMPDFHPKHAKAYLKLHEAIRDAVKQYVSEVGAGKFPPKS